MMLSKADKITIYSILILHLFLVTIKMSRLPENMEVAVGEEKGTNPDPTLLDMEDDEVPSGPGPDTAMEFHLDEGESNLGFRGRGSSFQ